MTMLQYIFIAFALAFIGAGYYIYRMIELIKFMRTQELKWKDATNNAR